MFCYQCGAEIQEDAIYCPHCGCATINHSASAAAFYPEDVSIKSRLIALLLCAFLGYLGIHRFYIGKFGTGILWLFTGGCFGIGYIVDLVLIACGSMRDGAGYAITCWEPA